MQTLIKLLMSGGSYGHYWSKQSKTTTWWRGDSPPAVPTSQEDLYFGVHPSKVRKSSTERTVMDDIEAINCLYADVDAKSFAGSKAKAAAHVKQLAIAPSVIVDSGGGYHCYWLLDRPFILDTPLKFEIAQELQKRWVTFVNGDPAVHDLARILRIPGTFNFKPEYGSPQPVKFVFKNLTRRFTLAELEAALPAHEHRGDDEDVAPKIPAPPKPNRLSSQEVVDLAQSSQQGSSFVQLWRGYNEGYESSSEGDLALCCMLAFWTGGDYEKMDTLFRLSARMRSKWEREDYRHGTLIKALGQVTAYYTDPGGFLTASADDAGNAQCVYARCKDKYLYCMTYGWMKNVGSHWKVGGVPEAKLRNEIVGILKQRRSAAVLGTDDSNEKKLEAIIKISKPSAANVAHCLMILKPLLTVGAEVFEGSLDEINCKNGVVNLRTGTVSKSNKRKKFPYCLSIPYEEDADSSIWETWLLEAVGDEQEVVDYLQMAIGYSLSGRTREEIMFYIHGPARAGKGIFTETIQAMLNGRPLATEVGMETFLDKRKGNDPGFDLATLSNTRFVAASESESSWWLNASRIKRWTGGSPISCAFKYKGQFTYKPQFKIWLASNFPPQLEADDVAAWARIQVMHFPNSYLGREDKTLKERMRSPEVLKGVLKWAVEGAIKWYNLSSGGLQPPQVIVEETKRAWSALDWVTHWVEEEVIVTGRDEDRVANSVFHTRYEDWCNEQGVSAKKLPALNKALKRLKVGTKCSYFQGGKTRRGLSGIKLQGTSFREGLAAVGESDLEPQDV